MECAAIYYSAAQLMSVGKEKVKIFAVSVPTSVRLAVNIKPGIAGMFKGM